MAGFRTRINKKTIPVSWEEATYEDYEALLEKGSDPLKHFTGFSMDDFRMQYDEQLIIDAVIIPLGFIAELPERQGGESDSIVKSIGERSIDQKMIADMTIQILHQEEKTVLAFPEIVAVYEQEYYDGETIEAKIKQVKKRPFKDTYLQGLDLMHKINENNVLMQNKLKPYQIPSTISTKKGRHRRAVKVQPLPTHRPARKQQPAKARGCKANEARRRQRFLGCKARGFFSRMEGEPECPGRAPRSP